MGNTFDTDFTPDMYDFDGDESFDFDNTDLGGEMIGSLPGDPSDDAEQHEKRKADGEDDEGGDVKRHETREGERIGKKPGRKPSMNEPTTKRKAQNRAAQRAFRERKEKHLKDLETQVTELTKVSEADKHENNELRAQVERLQAELKDYRKRLSSGSGAVTRSPSSKAQPVFDFDFPQFGSLPGNQLLNNSHITPPLSNQSPAPAIVSSQTAQLRRQDSEGRGISPTADVYIKSQSPSQVVDTSFDMAPFSTNNNMHGFASTLPQMDRSAGDPFGDLFSPSILKTVKQSQSADRGYFANNTSTKARDMHTAGSQESSSGGDSSAGIPDNRVFRFNSHSIASDSASPSASSLSQWQNNTTNSSCGTSPEPLVDSPANHKSPSASQAIMPQYSFSHLSPHTSSTDVGLTSLNDSSFSGPQLSSFDPVLFGGYRETNDDILGGGDLSGGYFDDSTDGLYFDSPSNLFGILTSPATSSALVNAAPTPSDNLMAQLEKSQDEVEDNHNIVNTFAGQAPAVAVGNGTSNSGKMVSCANIWSQLHANQDFKDGNFDLDGLCAELRTKARCSESGLVVDAEHVDNALKNFKQSARDHEGPSLLFDQDVWDTARKKMVISRGG